MADWEARLNFPKLEQQHGLPSGLLRAVMQQESKGNPNAVSHRGATGLFQFMPRTARHYGIDPLDPAQAATAAAKMYGELFKKYGGDIDRALAGYNWGQGNVDRKGMDLAPTETKDYIRKVKALMGTNQGRDLTADLFGSTLAAPQKPTTPTVTKPAAQKPTTPATGGRDLSADLFGGSLASTARPRNATEVKLTPKMNDDDIIRAFGYDPKIIKAAGSYKPGIFQSAVTDPDGWFAKYVGDSSVGSFIRGLRDPVDAGAQLVTRGLNKIGLQSDADVAFIELMNKVSESDYQQNWRRGKKVDPTTGEADFELSRFAGNVVVPVKGAGLIKGGSAAANVARAATAGGIAATTQQQVLNTSTDVNADADNFWSEKGKQGVTGVVLGPVAQAAVKGLTKATVKGYNAIKGRIQPAAQEIIDEAAKRGVPVTYGDITQGPIATKAEVALESIPGPMGTTAIREAQQTAVKTAAGGVASDLRDQMINSGFKGLGDLRAAAAKGNKVAIALQEEIANAGDDWTKIVQTSGNLRAFRAKLIADKMYDKVEKLANRAGDVQLTTAQRAVDDAIEDVSNSKLPDRELLNLLQRLKEGLKVKTQTTASQILGPNGQPLVQNTKVLGDQSYTAARKLRSELGALIADHYKGSNAIVGERGVGYLARIQAAVEQDMDTFIRKSGNRELQTAADRANRFYRQTVVPYKDRALALALKEANPDEIYLRFIQQGKGDRAQAFINALDGKGRDAVKYGMVATAIDKATNETTGVFSPAKFAAALEKVKEARAVVFKGKDGWELNGFIKLMRHVERAGQYAENPPTGQRVIPWLIGGAATLDPATAGKAAAVITAAKLMFTTEAGKRYLLAASDLQPGSGAMQKLLARIEKEMPAVAAKATGQQQQSKEQE